MCFRSEPGSHVAIFRYHAGLLHLLLRYTCFRSSGFVHRDIRISCRLAASPATMHVLPFWTGFARRDFPISRTLAAQYIVNIICHIAAAYVCNRIAFPRDVVEVHELIT